MESRDVDREVRQFLTDYNFESDYDGTMFINEIVPLLAPLMLERGKWKMSEDEWLGKHPKPSALYVTGATVDQMEEAEKKYDRITVNFEDGFGKNKGNRYATVYLQGIPFIYEGRFYKRGQSKPMIIEKDKAITVKFREKSFVEHPYQEYLDRKERWESLSKEARKKVLRIANEIRDEDVLSLEFFVRLGEIADGQDKQISSWSLGNALHKKYGMKEWTDLKTLKFKEKIPKKSFKLLDTIDELDTGEGADFYDLLKLMQQQGMTKKKIENAFLKFQESGDIFENKIGTFQTFRSHKNDDYSKILYKQHLINVYPHTIIITSPIRNSPLQQWDMIVDDGIPKPTVDDAKRKIDAYMSEFYGNPSTNPIRSKAQWRYLHSQEPEIAEKWKEEYPDVDYDDLPEKVKNPKAESLLDIIGEEEFDYQMEEIGGMDCKKTTIPLNEINHGDETIQSYMRPLADFTGDNADTELVMSHMDENKFNRLRQLKKFPPIIVKRIDKGYKLIDGFHRIAIANERGMSKIDAYVCSKENPNTVQKLPEKKARRKFAIAFNKFIKSGEVETGYHFDTDYNGLKITPRFVSPVFLSEGVYYQLFRQRHKKVWGEEWDKRTTRTSPFDDFVENPQYKTVKGEWIGYHQTSKYSAQRLKKEGFIIEPIGNQRFGVGAYFKNEPLDWESFGDTNVRVKVKGRFLDLRDDIHGDKWKDLKNIGEWRNYEEMTELIRNKYPKINGILFPTIIVVFDANNIEFLDYESMPNPDTKNKIDFEDFKNKIINEIEDSDVLESPQFEDILRYLGKTIYPYLETAMTDKDILRKLNSGEPVSLKTVNLYMGSPHYIYTEMEENTEIVHNGKYSSILKKDLDTYFNKKGINPSVDEISLSPYLLSKGYRLIELEVNYSRRDADKVLRRYRKIVKNGEKDEYSISPQRISRGYYKTSLWKKGEKPKEKPFEIILNVGDIVEYTNSDGDTYEGMVYDFQKSGERRRYNINFRNLHRDKRDTNNIWSDDNGLKLKIQNRGDVDKAIKDWYDKSEPKTTKKPKKEGSYIMAVTHYGKNYSGIKFGGMSEFIILMEHYGFEGKYNKRASYHYLKKPDWLYKVYDPLFLSADEDTMRKIVKRIVEMRGSIHILFKDDDEWHYFNQSDGNIEEGFRDKTDYVSRINRRFSKANSYNGIIKEGGGTDSVKDILPMDVDTFVEMAESNVQIEPSLEVVNRLVSKHEEARKERGEVLPKETSKMLRQSLKPFLPKGFRVTTGKGKTPYIEVRSKDWRDMSKRIPNDFRIFVVKLLMKNANIRNWDNIHYGNISETYISLSQSQWHEVMNNLNRFDEIVKMENNPIKSILLLAKGCKDETELINKIRKMSREEVREYQKDWDNINKKRRKKHYDAFSKNIFWHSSPKEIKKFEFTMGERGGFMGSNIEVENLAIFLTDNKEVAYRYGENRSKRGYSPNIYRVRVKMKKILDLEKMRGEIKKVALKWREKYDGKRTNKIPKSYYFLLIDDKNFINKVKSHGYDTIKFPETYETLKKIGVSKKNKDALTYASLYPENLLIESFENDPPNILKNLSDIMEEAERWKEEYPDVNYHDLPENMPNPDTKTKIDFEDFNNKIINEIEDSDVLESSQFEDMLRYLGRTIYPYLETAMTDKYILRKLKSGEPVSLKTVNLYRGSPHYIYTEMEENTEIVHNGKYSVILKKYLDTYFNEKGINPSKDEISLSPYLLSKGYRLVELKETYSRKDADKVLRKYRKIEKNGEKDEYSISAHRISRGFYETSLWKKGEAKEKKYYSTHRYYIRVGMGVPKGFSTDDYEEAKRLLKKGQKIDYDAHIIDNLEFGTWKPQKPKEEEFKEKPKNLSQFKKYVRIGMEFTLVRRDDKILNQKRTVSKIQTNGIYFKGEEIKNQSWLEYPRAYEMTFTDDGFISSDTNITLEYKYGHIQEEKTEEHRPLIPKPNDKVFAIAPALMGMQQRIEGIVSKSGKRVKVTKGSVNRTFIGINQLKWYVIGDKYLDYSRKKAQEKSEREYQQRKDKEARDDAHRKTAMDTAINNAIENGEIEVKEHDLKKGDLISIYIEPYDEDEEVSITKAIVIESVDETGEDWVTVRYEDDSPDESPVTIGNSRITIKAKEQSEGTKEEMAQIIERVNQEFKEEYNLSPSEITDGSCIEYADYVVNQIGDEAYTLSSELSSPESNSIFVNGKVSIEGKNYFEKDIHIDNFPLHTWVYYHGKHYDAEMPEGVAVFHHLPIFERWRGKKEEMPYEIILNVGDVVEYTNAEGDTYEGMVYEYQKSGDRRRYNINLRNLHRDKRDTNNIWSDDKGLKLKIQNRGDVDKAIRDWYDKYVKKPKKVKSKLKEIDLTKNIKEQFDNHHLIYPHKKSSGMFGLPRSTLLDRRTEKSSVDATLDYLEKQNIIKIKDKKNNPRQSLREKLITKGLSMRGYLNCKLFVQQLLDEPHIGNLKETKNLNVGDVIVWGGDLPDHYAVYLGDNEVIEVEQWGARPRVVPFTPSGEETYRRNTKNNPTNSERNQDIQKLLFTIKNEKEERGESPYRWIYPKVRGGWTMKKIKRELKKVSSSSGDKTFDIETMRFHSPQEFEDNLFWHGTGGFVSGGLKAGVSMGIRFLEQQGGGGYGDEYYGISLSKNKNMASNFTGQSGYGNVYPVILKYGATVKEMPEIQDANELEDILIELWEQGIDAVKIGDWSSDYSEQEIVILNPKAIHKGKGEGFRVYKKKRFEQPSKEEIFEMWETSATRYKNYREKEHPNKPLRYRTKKIIENFEERKREMSHKKNPTLFFPNKSKKQLEHIHKAQQELQKGGVTFDTGTELESGRRDWELDFSLKGAKVNPKKEKRTITIIPNS